MSYDWLWNIGDRTALFSDGWMDPISGGPRFFTAGAAYTRPDKTNFTLSYRQIDPLDSKAVIASITYPLSAKYAITGSTMYDFGVQHPGQHRHADAHRHRPAFQHRFQLQLDSEQLQRGGGSRTQPVPDAGRGGLGAQGGGIGQTR